MKIEKVLIIRTDRIGDLTLTLPMAAEIKKHLPKSRVYFLVKKYTAPLVRLNKFIDEVIEVDNLNFFNLLTLLIKGKFDVVFHVYPRANYAFAAFLSLIKIRVGTGYRWYSFLFNNKVYEHRKSGDKHELEYNFSLLEKININVEPNFSSVDFSIQPLEKDVTTIEQIFTKHGIDRDKKTIIIHPGSGGSAIDLPLDKMKVLINLLAQSLKFNIILTGSQAEYDLCESLKVSKNVLNFSGKFNLTELVALISKCDLLIANSTGPIHIAAALNKYTVGFYPKFNECSAKRWGPYTTKRFIFEPELNCKDCNRKQCEKLNCMNYIDINKVFDTIIKIFYSSEEL